MYRSFPTSNNSSNPTAKCKWKGNTLKTYLNLEIKREHSRKKIKSIMILQSPTHLEVLETFWNTPQLVLLVPCWGRELELSSGCGGPGVSECGENTQDAWCRGFTLQRLSASCHTSPRALAPGHKRLHCTRLWNQASACLMEELRPLIVLTEVIARTEWQLEPAWCCRDRTRKTLRASVCKYSAIVFPMVFLNKKFYRRRRAARAFRIHFRLHLLPCHVSYPLMSKNCRGCSHLTGLSRDVPYAFFREWRYSS